MTRNLAAAALVLVFAAAGCGGSGGEGGRSAVIQVDGSSTVFPIAEAVAEEFQKANPGARVTVGISGTGGGFQKFCRGETDLSDASRPIKDVEIQACRQAGIDFIELPIAYDGLAIVVHPQNTWADSITVEELKRLWQPAASGQLKLWSDVRPGWPSREIHLFGPGVDSGTFDYFTEAIVGKGGESRGDYTSSEDDNVLVQGVSTDELALGYFGYAYYEENQGKLKLVPVDNGSGPPVAPTPETIRTGTYTPLSRPIFLYASTKALVRPEVERFVDFFMSEGADLVREVGYVPLTDREYELARQRFADRTTGTMFAEGSHEPGTTLETLLTGTR